MIEDYAKRINKYHKLEIIEIPDNDSLTEGKRILKYMNKGYNVSLVIEGLEISSLELSKIIDYKLMKHANINFIIGGSNGLSEDVINKSDKLISFSKLTFPHGLFRCIFLEQIYRSFKILNNETYHK